jgi:hypothetical protein
MKKENIIAMARALNEVREAVTLDVVNKKQAKGRFLDRDDKDIDNDGDVDNSDRYLHKKRRAITKATSKKNEVEVQVQEAGQMSKNKVETQPADNLQNSKEIKQKKEKSVTKDQGKLNNIQSPKELDYDYVIKSNEKEEEDSQRDAARPVATLEMNEDYQSVEMRYINRMKEVANKISKFADELYADDKKAREAQKRINIAYRKGVKPNKTDLATSNKKLYDCKYLVRSLEDALDQIESKALVDGNIIAVSESTKPVNPETRTPVSIKDALAMMSENDRSKHYKGALPAQTIDDNWSQDAKNFAKMHKVDEPDEADINKATAKNKIEVGASLARAVNYRHNDQSMGDKTVPGKK